MEQLLSCIWTINRNKLQNSNQIFECQPRPDNPVDPALYYFRVSLAFETASTVYGWLNRTVCIGSAMRVANAVLYDAYAVE